jgi:YD repeat-containing protein
MKTFAYSYDEYGRMSEISHPDGRTVAYGYDLADRIVRVTDSILGDTSYNYDAQGNVLSCTRPDATSSTYAYDVLNRLTRLVNKRGDTVLSSFDYTYDSEGRIVTESVFQLPAEDTARPGRVTRAYAYDAAGRLESCVEDADGARTKTEYSYNMFGNRVARVTSEDERYLLVCAYDEDGRITEQTDEKTGAVTRYTWDDDGNLIAKMSENEGRPTVLTDYIYDAENRLKAVREGGELLMAATYDGDGNRVFQVPRTVTSVPAEDAGPGANARP